MASGEVDYEKSNKSKFRTKWDAFCRFLWNSDTKEVMGRTGASWAKIGLFYLIFYSCLAAFFAGMLGIFFTTLDKEQPSQSGMTSLIKGNPGMGYRPQVKVESTLISVKQGVPEVYNKLAESIDEALKAYKKPPANAINCAGIAPGEVPEGKVCEFSLEMLGDQCLKKTDNNTYGYDEGAPCVLLKMNKVYGWKPKPFNNETIPDTPKEHVDEYFEKVGERNDTEYIGISCEGENEADADHLGEVEYFPEKGYPSVFYPYTHQKGYMAPLVFVHFKQPRRGVLIQVWCKLWAANIKHHKNDKAGSIHFELYVN